MARKMKDSGIEWIGEIPEGWEVTRLKYLADFEPTCDTSYLTDESEITYTPMECVKNGDFENRSALYGNLSHTLTPFQNGDIAMAKVTPCFENGNIAIMNNLFSGFGLGSSELFIFRPKSIFTRYLFYWLQNKAFVARACSTMTGTGGLKRISPSFIRNCPVHCPSMDEQTKISDYLKAKCSEIDTMLSKTRSSIEEYKKLKQAVITQAVTTLNCPNVKLKYLMDIIVDCPHETPIYTFTGNYLVIRTSDQSLASLRCDEYMYRLDEAEYKKRTRRLTLDKDDIVYGREGSWGLACLVPQSNKYCLGQRVMQFRCNTRLLYPKYAMYALNSETVYMQGALDTIGSTAPHVNISTICNYLLPVPALNEQKEITNYLDAKCAEIDKLIAKKEQLVKELESYKKSLIYEVVTGKREV